MAGFDVTGTRVVHEAGFLSLAEERVRTPDGEELTRFTVRHPGAVVVVPLDGQERVVMVRQYRTAARRELLEVPAGKREPGEDPETTAARELEEEVGLSPGRLVKLAEFYNSPGFCDEYSHLFLARDLAPVEERAEVKAEERHMTVERVPLADALGLVASGEIVDAKSIIGIALAARDA